MAINAWQSLRDNTKSNSWIANLPTPPSLADATVDRYLKIDLDGGQFKVLSPSIPSSRLYQYQLRCDVKTQGLRYDTAKVEFVFLDRSGDEIMVKSSDPLGGTQDWSTIVFPMVRPPKRATVMAVRLIVQRSEDGFEDIRGTIGFDNVRIDQFPQLRVTTDRSHGVYPVGDPVEVRASILGLTSANSIVHFRVIDHEGKQVDSGKVPIDMTGEDRNVAVDAPPRESSEVSWRGRLLEPGFYHLFASIEGPSGRGQSHFNSFRTGSLNAKMARSDAARSNGSRSKSGSNLESGLRIQKRSILTSETTLAVIDPAIEGAEHSPFGWTLPRDVINIPLRELVSWLSSVGVTWVKYPCWIAADDTVEAEKIATMMGKLQDAGIHTVGMLDAPPEREVAKYQLRARRDLVASQLFRDVKIWQPELEPVMSRMSLKVRTWQLGGERDFSFLGRPRLRESVQQISKGLQGFGQPIDVAISWPWLESELPDVDTSWQAVCRSVDPPLGAEELDAFLSLQKKGST